MSEVSEALKKRNKALIDRSEARKKKKSKASSEEDKKRLKKAMDSLLGQGIGSRGDK